MSPPNDKRSSVNHPDHYGGVDNPYEVMTNSFRSVGRNCLARRGGPSSVPWPNSARRLAGREPMTRIRYEADRMTFHSLYYDHEDKAK